MIRTTTTIEIARALPLVFGFIADVHNMPRWNPGVVSVITDRPAPLVEGARFRLLSRNPGRPAADITCVVTGYAPHSFLACSARAAARVIEGVTVDEEGWLAFKVERAFHDVGGATRVDLTYALEEHPFAGLSGWSDRILARRTRRELAFAERRLKRVLEEPPRRG